MKSVTNEHVYHERIQSQAFVPEDPPWILPMDATILLYYYFFPHTIIFFLKIVVHDVVDDVTCG
tara:strand:- start:425 stop:616 length:192 start_codon:yes stop_codon:yes gene_type:complete